MNHAIKFAFGVAVACAAGALRCMAWEPGDEYPGSTGKVVVAGAGVRVYGPAFTNGILVLTDNSGTRAVCQNPTNLTLSGSITSTTVVVNVTSTTVNSAYAALAGLAITSVYANTAGVAAVALASFTTNATYAVLAGAATNAGYAVEAGHATNADMAAHALVADYAAVSVSVVTSAAPYSVVSGASSNAAAGSPLAIAVAKIPTNYLAWVLTNGVYKMKAVNQ